MNIEIVNTAKAVIFDGDNVLLIKKEYEDGRTLYTLPGGSQNPGETLQQTLTREMLEETAAAVVIIDLVKVYEYQQISKSDPGLIRHKIEFAFHCAIDGTYTPIMGPHPDPHQTDVVWFNKQALSEIMLHPQELKNVLLPEALPGTGYYLGKVN
jgi:ADP-ribose pyrophosphatase YjhB (NUDIX family)